MASSAVSFYYEFACLAGQCPAGCCYGWRIPVDDESLLHYMELPGVYGRHVRLFINARSDPPTIRRILGRCPFHDSDGLCTLQRIGRGADMPLVCRIYPRDSVKCGNDIEVTMELSCPAAARLLLTHPERLDFIPIGRDIEPLSIIDNDDPVFLDFLKQDREDILDFIWDVPEPLPVKWQALYAYVRHENDIIVRNHLDMLGSLAISTDPGEQGDYYIDRTPTYAFFSVKTLDRMILEHLDYGAMPIRNPKFYRLIRQYLAVYSNETTDSADALLHRTVEEMTERTPGLGDMYRSYFSYCIQELYLLAYENYFILRQILFAILYVEFLMIFDSAEYITGKRRPITLDRQVEILTLCEHCIRHNPSLTQNLMQVMREEFL